jgi:hypothetical protein
MGDIVQAASARVIQMAKDADDLIGLIDQQTYDEYRRGDWDLPDDCELLVTFTAADLRKLDRILHSYLRACQTGATALSMGSASAGAPQDE